MDWYQWSPKLLLRCLSISATLVLLSAFVNKIRDATYPSPVQTGVKFQFKNQKFALLHPMRRTRKRGPVRQTNARLDTLSNWLSMSKKYVEIIRQDHPLQPHFGIALGFEFDPDNTSYPYEPAIAKIQFKDFSWGGVEFSPRDSSNYTGVSNAVSDDLTVEVDGFQNDTIFGRFHGLLLSAAGTMAPVDSGYFRVFVYRVE